jgi:uracil-DNA glycosylase
MADLLKNQWQAVIGQEFSKAYYHKINAYLEEAYKNDTIYPVKSDIFSALNYSDYEEVKVVILGQDPYHGENQAHGLSFSVKPGVKVPPSLRNIYKELATDMNCYIPNNGYLEKWAKQGVLLLNAVLTVRAGDAGSHQKIGWQEFTDTIIKSLNMREKPIVFILWGNYAKSKRVYITNPQHMIIESVHPSPLSASRGFFGTRPFSRANEFLEAQGMQAIDWQIENI